MTILRVMIYALNGTPSDGAESIARTIRNQRPELVFFQYLSETFLEELAQKTGLDAYQDKGRCGFLSCHSITALHSCDLGGAGDCLRADLTLSDKRVHLFNLQLASDPIRRGRQIARLFAGDLLGGNLPCATLVGGDFSFPLWGGGQWLLRLRLKPVRHPSWGANYPASFPLWPRDRIFLNGPIRSLAGQVIATPETRSASSHLPLVVTLELTDMRNYLKIRKVAEPQMRPVTG